jgi:DEAD/DEAH box helicase domain-containing protein
MKDKLVLDIETKDTFADVNGHQNVEKLNASLVGLYSYNENRYLSFRENEWEKLAPILQNASLIIGFSINSFDLPILKKYFNFNVMSLARFDLLEEVEISYGQRVGLDVLARANLGIGKTHHGLDAIEFYKNGDWQSLTDYCLHDVRITKDLYELVKKRGYILIPKKYSEEIVKVPINIREVELPATLF